MTVITIGKKVHCITKYGEAGETKTEANWL